MAFSVARRLRCHAAMAKTRRREPGDTTAATADRDRIAQRAYELYMARGGDDGRDLDDWLEAERELVQNRGTGGKRTSDPEA